jgi:hypothetical protein
MDVGGPFKHSCEHGSVKMRCFPYQKPLDFLGSEAATKWSWSVKCVDCSSSRFRLSRFRWADLEQLALLQYPVRCRNCHRRTFGSLFMALGLYKARRAKQKTHNIV